MIRIIRTRPLQITDLSLARLLKPFEDANLVYDLPAGEEFDLLQNILADSPPQNVYFEQIIKPSPHKVEMLPSELYDHLCTRSTMIPTLIQTHYNGNRYTRIQRLDTVPLINQLLVFAHAKELVHGCEKLIGVTK